MSNRGRETCSRAPDQKVTRGHAERTIHSISAGDQRTKSNVYLLYDVIDDDVRGGGQPRARPPGSCQAATAATCMCGIGVARDCESPLSVSGASPVSVTLVGRRPGLVEVP